MVAVMRDMAQFVCCEAQDLVFVPNVTTALNTVIQGTPLGPGRHVLMLNIGYSSTKLIACAACEKAGASLILAEVKLPIAPGCEPSCKTCTLLSKHALSMHDLSHPTRPSPRSPP
jgi:hypothetical protein